MMRSAGKVGLAVMASRILGLARDQTFAYCFGGGRLYDAFVMAFRIPNLLRDLFAEGALSSAFVTVFARTKAREGTTGAWRLARYVTTLQCVLLGVIVLLGIVFAPEIVRLIAPGYARDPGKLALTITLTRILFPFILFVGLAALTMGILNAYGRFGLPASASSFFNLGSIVAGIGLALIFDPGFGEKAILCMAVGALIGGLLQWLVQIPSLRKLGYRFSPAWSLRDPGVREIGGLMAPAVIGVSAVQINVVINSIFASGLGDGAVSWLAYAFRLIQLPIGMFGVAISTAALPSLAVDAELPEKGVFRQRIERALRLNALLCIPAACGLAMLSAPLVALLFQHGKFVLRDTLGTAAVLTAYSVGLVGYASVKVLAPAFYALGRARVPMAVSLGSIGVTILLSWFLTRVLFLGPAGLALATSGSALCNAAVLLLILTRLVGGVTGATWRALGKMVVAAGVMTAGVWLSGQLHLSTEGEARGWSNLIRVALGVGVGTATYFAMARWLKLEEVSEIGAMLRRKLGR